MSEQQTAGVSAPTPRPERRMQEPRLAMMWPERYVRYTITDSGRRVLAMDWLFGPKPTVAAVMARDAQQQTEGAA